MDDPSAEKKRIIARGVSVAKCSGRKRGRSRCRRRETAGSDRNSRGPRGRARRHGSFRRGVRAARNDKTLIVHGGPDDNRGYRCP